MNIRLFSHKHQLYTNSPNWPSNQRTWSDWALTPDGRILEIIHLGLPDRGDGHSYDDTVCQYHDKRNFSIEPWTGFYDCQNKKIYLGDIIKLQCFNLDYEIMWHIDRFGMKPLYESVDSDNKTPHHIRGQKDFLVDWRLTNTIHNVEYND